MTEVFGQHQLLLWVLTVFADLGFAVIDTPFIYPACQWRVKDTAALPAERL